MRKEPEKKKKPRSVVWASENAPASRIIVVCSTEADARRVHDLTKVATVALRALPLDARERLAERHIILALRSDATGAAIMQALNQISSAFASYKHLERVDSIADSEIQSIFARVADPFRWNRLPIPPTATGFRLKIRSEAQREAVTKYIAEHPGEFPVICYDLEARMKWVEHTVDSTESLKFFRYWFGGSDFVYSRAEWAFNGVVGA